jgi:hypothetical protein
MQVTVEITGVISLTVAFVPRAAPIPPLPEVCRINVTSGDIGIIE